MASTTLTTAPNRRRATDAHGNPMTGDADTIDRYDQAIDQLLRFRPQAVDLAVDLAAQPSAAPMAHALIAYLHLMSTDADDLGTAREAYEALVAAGGNEREQAHAAAVGAWQAGDWTGAARRLDDLLIRWPGDLLALMIGHQLDFFVGDALSLRDRPIRSLRELGDHPHAPFVSGMAAFGLEEAGHYQQAIDAGLAAIDANGDDVWAIHAVVHAYEMLGRVRDGIELFESDRTVWESGNLFTVHNWWHLAIYLLEAGRHDRSLEIYDAEIHHAGSPGAPIEMLDASALLWRLLLDDVDTGGRFGPLADSWVPKTSSEPWYVFNDLHATMALAGVGRLPEAHAVVGRLDRWLDSASGTNAKMTAEIGLPACRAVVAFAEGRHADVIAELYPIRRILQRFGGSHAQRDALQRTLLESSLRSGRFELARALTAERLGVRESSVYGWMQRARALHGLGDVTGADVAVRRAADYRAAINAGR